MKQKIDRRTLLWTTLICLLPMLFCLALYSRLPDPMPTHFDELGRVDGTMPKAVACFGLPVMMAVLNLVVHMALDHDPKRANASPRMVRMGKWTVPAAGLLAMGLTLTAALGYEVPIHMLVPVLIGLLFLFCGNYLPKSRQNYTVGIKLPWTLDSEENWNRTHRLAGKLWIAGGLVMIVEGFVHLPAVPVLLGTIAVMVGVPILYSFLLYRKGV